MFSFPLVMSLLSCWSLYSLSPLTPYPSLYHLPASPSLDVASKVLLFLLLLFHDVLRLLFVFLPYYLLSLHLFPSLSFPSLPSLSLFSFSSPSPTSSSSFFIPYHYVFSNLESTLSHYITPGGIKPHNMHCIWPSPVAALPHAWPREQHHMAT